MLRSVVERLSWLVVLLLPSAGFAQTSERMIPHPALSTEPMHPTHQLGKFGESFVRETLRASGFEVHDANLNERGIDLLAVRRDVHGTLTEVRPVEVKTRSQGFRGASWKRPETACSSLPNGPTNDSPDWPESIPIPGCVNSPPKS